MFGPFRPLVVSQEVLFSRVFPLLAAVSFFLPRPSVFRRQGLLLGDACECCLLGEDSRNQITWVVVLGSFCRETAHRPSSVDTLQMDAGIARRKKRFRIIIPLIDERDQLNAIMGRD